MAGTLTVASCSLMLGVSARADLACLFASLPASAAVEQMRASNYALVSYTVPHLAAPIELLSVTHNATADEHIA